MATVSIRETLGVLPGGTVKELDWKEVGQYLWREYLNADSDKGGAQRERIRRERAAEKQRFYQSCGDADMDSMIQKVFRDPEVIEKRRQWIEFAKFDNLLRRVIGELATVYVQPAKRRVGVQPVDENDAAKAAADEQNRRYQEVLRLCRFDEVMQRVNRMLVLHRAVVIVPRMRKLPDGQWVPVIDVLTPAKFHAVRDPGDATLLVGLIFETDYCLANQDQQAPKWTVWTWHERFYITSNGHVLEVDGENRALIEEHGIGRIPAVLATLEPPDGRLLDETSGDDLLAAQKTITFLHILTCKEAKSATKQPHVSGDVSNVNRRQSDDSEIPFHTPEGVQMQVHDRSMNFMEFEKAADSAREKAGVNNGIAPSVMRGDSVASADARDLERLPLREMRLNQHVPLRAIEREIAELLSLVVAQRRPDLAYTMDGWSIDFADPQTPLGRSEYLDVLRKELELGLKSEIRAIMHDNPDLSYEQAVSEMLAIIDDRTLRLEALRDFAVMSGGMAASANASGAEMRDAPQRPALTSIKGGKESPEQEAT